MIVRLRFVFAALIACWLVAGAPSHHHRADASSHTHGDVHAAGESSHAPRDEDAADCSICHLIATLTPSAPPTANVPALQLAARLDPPPRASLAGIRFILTHRGRGPPLGT